MIRVSAPGRAPVPIRVDDLTIRGARIRVPSQEPPLSVGAIVRLEVVGPTGTQIIVPARVVRTEEEPVRAYGMMFLEPAAVEARLTPELARLFNRRRVPRIRPEGLQAVVKGPNTRWAVTVRDLSIDAAALEADAPAPPLADGDAVVVSLPLGGPEPVRLAALLRTRPEGDDATRVVLAFDREARDEEARERLLRYVESRLVDQG